MDPREAYGWLLLLAVELALFAMSLYLVFSAVGALDDSVTTWVGGPFVHRPEAELRRYQYLGLSGVVITGGMVFLTIVGVLVRQKILGRRS